MGSCAAPSAKGDDKFITTDYLQQCQRDSFHHYGTLRLCPRFNQRSGSYSADTNSPRCWL
ncbi:hypothetical protein C5458_24800 [Salmonella enterica]|nr:hypothetical protein [Salmonella enterica]